MKISLIGLGKLGYPMAEFLSSSALSINCYDKNEKLVLDLINGRNYLEFENGLRNYINNGNKLNFHLKIQDCLKGSSIVFITVPTPSNKDGSFSNKYIIEVLDEISTYLKKNKQENPYLININSTVSPGSIKKYFIPYLENKGLKNTEDFALIYNPYFVALSLNLFGGSIIGSSDKTKVPQCIPITFLLLKSLATLKPSSGLV